MLMSVVILTQTADCRQAMICRKDTGGKIQHYFQNQVLTINRLNGLLLMLIRVKFYTLDMLKSAPISLNIK